MDVRTLLTLYADHERRALLLYRALAERFPDAAAAAAWRQMAEAEAAHFTVLQLAGDRLMMAGHADTDARVDAAALAPLEARLTALEEEASRPDLTLADAVGITVAWEDAEAERVAALLALVPDAVRPRLRAGLVDGLAAHYHALAALATAAAPRLVDRVRSLEARAARL